MYRLLIHCSNRRTDIDRGDSKVSVKRLLLSSIPLTNPRFHSLLEELFRCAERPQLSVRYRVAVGNALCAFLDRGASSHLPSVHGLCLSMTVWNRLFTIYLRESQDQQLKLTRKTLTTLVRLLGKPMSSSDGAPQKHSSALLDSATSRCLSFIYAFEDFSCVKPAMLFLEQLLSKRILTTSSLLISSAAAEANAMARAPKMVPPRPLVDLEKAILDFSGTIFHWTLHSEVGSSAGKLLVSFFQTIKSEPVFGHLESSTSPIWLRPFRDSISRYPEMLEPLEHYVVPSLLQMSTSDTLAFLRSLPLENLLRGDVSRVREEDIRLCLMTIKTLGERSRQLDLGTRRLQAFPLLSCEN